MNEPNREDIKSTVLVASESVLARWSSSAAAPADLLALADADAEQALAVIEMRRPHFVVLEQRFAASSRGATFVNHLCSNAELAGLEIRILPVERSAVLGASGPITGQLIASVARSLRQSPIRRARRIAMPKGAEMLVNGTPATLVNVSTFGLQVVCPTVLKPNEEAAVVIDRDGLVLNTRAEVAWSALELAPEGVIYRAGIAFASARPELINFESSRLPPVGKDAPK